MAHAEPVRCRVTSTVAGSSPGGPGPGPEPGPGRHTAGGLLEEDYAVAVGGHEGDDEVRDARVRHRHRHRHCGRVGWVPRGAEGTVWLEEFEYAAGGSTGPPKHLLETRESGNRDPDDQDVEPLGSRRRKTER